MDILNKLYCILLHKASSNFTIFPSNYKIKHTHYTSTILYNKNIKGNIKKGKNNKNMEKSYKKILLNKMTNINKKFNKKANKIENNTL